MSVLCLSVMSVLSLSVMSVLCLSVMSVLCFSVMSVTFLTVMYFFNNHFHITKFNSDTSNVLGINASVVQVSAHH